MERDPLRRAGPEVYARVVRAASAVGDPQRSVRPYVHVAGVAGKTSVAMLLAALLRGAAGRPRVALMVHPPPPSARPGDLGACATIDGARVSAESYAQAKEDVLRAAPECTRYEAHVLAALCALRAKDYDLLVVESALGGTHDATRVLGASGRMACLVVTALSRDHEGHLGAFPGEMARGMLRLHGNGAPVVAMDGAGTAQWRAVCAAAAQAGIARVECAADVLRHANASRTSLTLSDSLARGHAANVDTALAAFITATGVLGMRGSVPRSALALVPDVPGRLCVFWVSGREVVVDAAENEDSPVFALYAGQSACKERKAGMASGGKGRDKGSAGDTPSDGCGTRDDWEVPQPEADSDFRGEPRRVHWALGLSGCKAAAQHARLLARLGCSARYRVSLVAVAAPPDRPWIRPADHKALAHAVYARCVACGVEPNITHYRTLAEVLEGAGDERVVVLGSPHVVADFYAQYVCAAGRV